MARLPNIGEKPWGAVLIDFLTVELNADGTRKRTFDFEQDTDPGAVGAGKTWLDTANDIINRRNSDDTAWRNLTSGGGAITPPPEEPPEEPPDTIVVNLDGMAGLDFTGATDSSDAFQAIMDAHEPGMEYRFPAGTLKIHSITVTSKSFVTFRGVSRDTSIILWGGSDNEGIITFSGCHGISWFDIGVDNKSIVRFGGVRHFDVSNVTYDTCKFFDSATLPVTTQNDRYSVVFGFGSVPSKNITINNCIIEDLQLEYDHVRNVKVTNNISRRAISTAAMGSWAQNHNSVHEDILVSGNTIYLPRRAALGAVTFFHDIAGLNFVSYRRITVTNNTIIHSEPIPASFGDTTEGAGRIAPGITFGAPASSATGNIFEDITIEGNTLIFLDGSFLLDPHGAISCYGTGGNSVNYDNLIIRDNTIRIINLGGLAVTVRRHRSGIISGNTIINSWVGVRLADTISNLTMRSNRVINGSKGYWISNAIGGFDFDATNQYHNVSDPLLVEDFSGVNIAEEPTELSMQAGRPSAVTFLGNWTDQAGGTTNIHTTIDETPADDTDHVRSEQTPSSSPFAVALANIVLTDPAVSFAHALNYHYRKDFDAGDVIDLTVEIRQGYVDENTKGTLIASRMHPNIGGVGWISGTLSLSPAEADLITDYTALFARAVANVPA